MLFTLLKHEWLKLRRASYWTQSLAQTILLGFFGLYLAINFLVVGFFLDDLLTSAIPDKSPFIAFGGLLIYYFIMSLVMRYFLQKFPSLDIKPYTTLPVSRKSIASYLLIKSKFSFFNFLPLFIILPYFFTSVIPNQGLLVGINFLVFSLGFIMMNNFLAFYITRGLNLKNILPAALLISLLVLIISGLQWIHIAKRKIGVAGATGFQKYTDSHYSFSS